MQVIIAGPNENELFAQAYPAFAAAGFDVMAVVSAGAQLRDVAAQCPQAVLVVDALLAPTVDQAVDLLGGLGAGRLVVVLPAAWMDQRQRFEALDLLAGYAAHVDWSNLARSLASRVNAPGPGLPGQPPGPPAGAGVGDRPPQATPPAQHEPGPPAGSSEQPVIGSGGVAFTASLGHLPEMAGSSAAGGRGALQASGPAG